MQSQNMCDPVHTFSPSYCYPLPDTMIYKFCGMIYIGSIILFRWKKHGLEIVYSNYLVSLLIFFFTVVGAMDNIMYTKGLEHDPI